MPDQRDTRWIRLAANYLNDPRIIEAGPNAELVWIRGLAIARNNATDGALHRAIIAQATRDLRGKSATIDRLVDVGLWEPTDDGWRVPYERWARWQTTQADYEHQRKLARERQARHRSQDGW